jgi:phage shock protein C
MSPAPLTIDRNRAVLAGVCAGLAKWLGWSCRRARIAYVAFTILSGVIPGILAYFALYILIPDRAKNLQ